METQVTELLGGEEVLGPSVKSNLDLAHATRKGLPRSAAERLLGHLWEQDTSPGKSVYTYFRQILAFHLGPGVNLNPTESDILVRLANAVAKAVDVLGDHQKAVHWLNAPNRALGGEAPMTLLDTSAGTLEVDALLDRIEHGVYS